MLDILDIAARYYVPIIADEIYEHMVRGQILRFLPQVTNCFIRATNKARAACPFVSTNCPRNSLQKRIRPLNPEKARLTYPFAEYSLFLRL